MIHIAKSFTGRKTLAYFCGGDVRRGVFTQAPERSNCDMCRDAFSHPGMGQAIAMPGTMGVSTIDHAIEYWHGRVETSEGIAKTMAQAHLATVMRMEEASRAIDYVAEYRGGNLWHITRTLDDGTVSTMLLDAVEGSSEDQAIRQSIVASYQFQRVNQPCAA